MDENVKRKVFYHEDTMKANLSLSSPDPLLLWVVGYFEAKQISFDSETSKQYQRHALGTGYSGGSGWFLA